MQKGEADFAAWFENLKATAEGQVRQWLDDYESWLEALQGDAEEELDNWIASYKSAYNSAFVQWYTGVRDEAEQRIGDLIDALRGMLDEGAETALYKKLDDHEQRSVMDGGVHGLRLRDGWLQVEVSPGSWANLLAVRYGLTVRYINNLALSVAEINMLGRTVGELNNATERESA